MTDVEILESTYFDTYSVYRKEKIKKVNGVTEIVENLVHESIKGALSKGSDQTVSSEEVGKLVFNHKLFTNPNIDIKIGDKIEINKNLVFEASLPYKYSSHQEIPITYKGYA